MNQDQNQSKIPKGFRKATPEEIKRMMPQIEKHVEEHDAQLRKGLAVMVTPRKFGMDPMRKPYLDIGMEITCPNSHCQAHIAYVVKKLRFDEQITSGHFQGDSIRRGAPMKCVKCGMPWCLPDDNYRIHTRLGWFPPTV
jgi:hypothetical protein